MNEIVSIMVCMVLRVRHSLIKEIHLPALSPATITSQILTDPSKVMVRSFSNTSSGIIIFNCSFVSISKSFLGVVFSTSAVSTHVI